MPLLTHEKMFGMNWKETAAWCEWLLSNWVKGSKTARDLSILYRQSSKHNYFFKKKCISAVNTIMYGAVIQVLMLINA